MAPVAYAVGDWVRRMGFFSQLVFLLLVDWGSLHAFERDGAAWFHYAALIALNVVLLAAAFFVYRWLRTVREPGPVSSSHGEG